MAMEDVFSAGNMAAMTGWMAILVALFFKPARKWLFVYSGLILPAVFAVIYVTLLGRGMMSSDGPAMDFGSLAGVKALFADDGAMTVGWYHYLAFDLFVGTMIARDGLSRGAWPILLVPIMALTFMFGPTGLLVYLVLWAALLRGKGPARTPFVLLP